jgi:hypothetical protein
MLASTRVIRGGRYLAFATLLALVALSALGCKEDSYPDGTAGDDAGVQAPE